MSSWLKKQTTLHKIFLEFYFAIFFSTNRPVPNSREIVWFSVSLLFLGLGTSTEKESAEMRVLKFYPLYLSGIIHYVYQARSPSPLLFGALVFNSFFTFWHSGFDAMDQLTLFGPLLHSFIWPAKNAFINCSN